jgi:hypothetical protein
MIMQPVHEPALIMSLGTICIYWSYLEMFMSLYYALMIFGRDITEEQNSAAYLAVVDAFESLSTWGSKRKLLVAATRRRLGKETAKKLDDLLKNIEKRQVRRNSVVHARWFYSNESAKWVRKRGLVTVDDPEVFDNKKFMQLRNDILDDTTALGAFFDDLKPILKGTVLGPYLNAYIAAMQQNPADSLKGNFGGT